MPSIALLDTTLSAFITIYTGLLFVRILLTWFPNISFYDQPFATLAQLTDPYLNVFRSIIPPLGGMDLSPMLAIIILQLLGGFVAGIPALV